jgi:hypothetical protein
MRVILGREKGDDAISAPSTAAHPPQRNRDFTDALSEKHLLPIAANRGLALQQFADARRESLHRKWFGEHVHAVFEVAMA